MTTNQTIDGVPGLRELLSKACQSLKVFLDHDLCECEGGHVCGRTEVEKTLKELRTLLDAPAVEVRDRCGVQMVNCPECTHQWDHFFECRNKPAAQPQGEPVAEVYRGPVSGISRIRWIDYQTAPVGTKLYADQPKGGQVINLDAVDWEAIQKAADESNWMPNEYMRNEWVADVCNFLKYGRAEQPAPVAFDFELAAQKLASCMDYPWDYMPEQGRASMREHAKAIIGAAQVDPVALALPDRDRLRDLIAQAIGSDTYDCVRVWSAWGVGTMSEDDFVPVVEQEARLYEIADACLDELKRLNPSL